MIGLRLGTIRIALRPCRWRIWASGRALGFRFLHLGPLSVQVPEPLSRSSPRKRGPRARGTERQHTEIP